MAVTNVHTLYAVAVTALDLCDQIQRFRVNTAIEKWLLAGDGAVDPTFVAVARQQPAIEFSSTKVATILTNCGVSGLQLTTGAELTAFFQKVAEGGTRAGVTSHLKLVINEGILIPQQIVAGNDQPATISLLAVASYNGTNDPIVLTASQTLAGTPVVSEAFVAGPVTINGSTIHGVQSITINFGIRLWQLSGDGLVWPTFVAIAERRPSISIVTPDPLNLNTFGLAGIAQSATNSVVYLREVAEGGTRGAGGADISFTIDEGHISIEEVTGNQGEFLGTQILISPTWDGANAIFVISTAASCP